MRHTEKAANGRLKARTVLADSLGRPGLSEGIRVNASMPTMPEARSFLGLPAIVASQAMKNVLALVERIAKTNATVLIQGEGGSGKEVIARAIHHYLIGPPNRG